MYNIDIHERTAITLYLRRKIDSFLDNWKSAPERKPLIVSGARQTGKTESILNFAKKNYESVIDINFVSDPKYKMIVATAYRSFSSPFSNCDRYAAPS